VNDMGVFKTSRRRYGQSGRELGGGGGAWEKEKELNGGREARAGVKRRCGELLSKLPSY